MNDKVFSHSGDSSDLIAALPTVKALGGGQLFLYPSSSTLHPMSKDLVESLRPLLECQSYINAVDFKEQPEGINLDEWRNNYMPGYNLADMVSNSFGVPLSPREEPWLTVPEIKRISKVVFHRSLQHRNGNFQTVWKKAWEKYRWDAVFVGHPQEHAEFCTYVGAIPYYPAKNYLDLAQIIAGCDLFISNQSAPFWVAEGLKKQLVLEASLELQNCHFAREGFIYGVNEYCELPDTQLTYGREPWMGQVIDLFKSRGLSNVVELGSIRDLKGKKGDGHSTMAWVQNADEVYSVDIDPKSTELTRKVTSSYGNMSAVCMDGILFLKSFHLPIDLLYLDAWDVGTPEFQEKHLQAYQAAKKNLHAKSLILIDDTFEGGKGDLVIPAAIADGYKIIFQDYMTLLSQ